MAITSDEAVTYFGSVLAQRVGDIFGGEDYLLLYKFRHHTNTMDENRRRELEMSPALDVDWLQFLTHNQRNLADMNIGEYYEILGDFARSYRNINQPNPNAKPRDFFINFLFQYAESRKQHDAMHMGGPTGPSGQSPSIPVVIEHGYRNGDIREVNYQPIFPQTQNYVPDPRNTAARERYLASHSPKKQVGDIYDDRINRIEKQALLQDGPLIRETPHVEMYDPETPHPESRLGKVITLINRNEQRLKNRESEEARRLRTARAAFEARPKFPLKY
jgi:hypothetical protein